MRQTLKIPIKILYNKRKRKPWIYQKRSAFFLLNSWSWFIGALVSTLGFPMKTLPLAFQHAVITIHPILRRLQYYIKLIFNWQWKVISPKSARFILSHLPWQDGDDKVYWKGKINKFRKIIHCCIFPVGTNSAYFHCYIY